MAKDEKKEDKAKSDATPEDAAKKKKKRLIVIILGALLLVGGGSAAAFMFLVKGKKPAQQVPAEGAEALKGGEGDGAGSPEKTGEHAAKEGEEKKEEHGKPGETEKKEEQAKPEEKKDEKKDAGNAKDAAMPSGKKDEKVEVVYTGDFGKTFPLQPFHLNLGNPLENRYIRLDVALEFKGGDEQEAELKARTAQLRDVVVSIVSKKSREQLLSPDGKDQLRREIRNKINDYVDKKIENVFITDILIE